jgi:hypothetical protein
MTTSFTSQIAHFTQQLRDGIIPLSAPLNPDVENYVIKAGIKHGGRWCNIIAVNPMNLITMQLLSETAVLHGKLIGDQNVKPRTSKEILYNARIDERAPYTRGGIVTAVESEGELIVMASNALIADPGEGGRGYDYDLCPLHQQTYNKMAICHPKYAGKGYMQLMTAERLKNGVDMARKYNRSHFVTKVVEGTPTEKFYKKTLGFKSDGKVYILPEVEDPTKNRLLTYGQTVDDVQHYLVKTYPDVANSESILDKLYANYYLKPNKESEPVQTFQPHLVAV